MTQAEILKLVEAAVAKAMAAQKIVNGPAPKDAPNAPSPDDAVAGGMAQEGLAHWRSPSELQGQRIFTSGGYIDVAASGIVATRNTDDHLDECSCAGCGVNRELRQRGFRRMQSKKSAAEIVGDEIRTILAGGAARGRAMDAARNLDKTGSLAAEPGGDVMKWLSKRNEANFPRPEVTRWNPKEIYIEKLVAKGYSLLEATKIANGDTV